MKREITEDEIYYLAKCKRVHVKDILRLADCIDTSKLRRMFIRYECKRREREGVMSKRDIILLLSEKYKMSKTYIEDIVYEKIRGKIKKKCLLCGAKVSLYTWAKYDGRCRECAMDNIYK